MNVQITQIQSVIHQRMHSILKIEVKRCEQISTIAQGIIIASAACLALPQTLGFIIAGVSLLSSVMLAFPDFIRFPSLAELESQNPTTFDPHQKIARSDISSSYGNDDLSILNSRKQCHHDVFSNPFPKNKFSTHSWANKEQEKSSKRFREYVDAPGTETIFHETVGSRSFEERTNQQVRKIIQEDHTLHTPPLAVERVAVGTRAS